MGAYFVADLPLDRLQSLGCGELAVLLHIHTHKGCVYGVMDSPTA